MITTFNKPQLYENSPLCSLPNLDMFFFYNSKAGTILTPNGGYRSASDLNLVSGFLQVLDIMSQNVLTTSTRFFITENAYVFNFLHTDGVNLCGIFTLPKKNQNNLLNNQYMPVHQLMLPDFIDAPLKIADIVARECLDSRIQCLITNTNQVLANSLDGSIVFTHYYALSIQTLLTLESFTFTLTKIMCLFLNRYRQIVSNQRSLNYSPTDLFDDFWDFTIN